MRDGAGFVHLVDGTAPAVPADGGDRFELDVELSMRAGSGLAREAVPSTAADLGADGS